MTQTAPISSQHIEELTQRISKLEQSVDRLTDVLSAAITSSDDPFSRLYRSKTFQQHIQETMIRYKKHPDQFVDPFTTYSET